MLKKHSIIFVALILLVFVVFFASCGKKYESSGGGGGGATNLEILYVFPTAESIDVDRNIEVTVTFNATLEENSFSGAFTLTPSGGSTGVTGTVSYSADMQTVSFKPVDNLGSQTRYTANIGGGVMAASGSIGALSSAFSWNFNTSTVVDTTPPALATSTVSSGEIDVAINKELKFTFDEEINPYFSIVSLSSRVGSTLTRISGSSSYDTSGEYLQFTPAAVLGYDTFYVISILARDMKGNESTTVLTFTTSNEPATFPLTLGAATLETVALAVGTSNRGHVTFRGTELTTQYYYLVTSADNYSGGALQTLNFGPLSTEEAPHHASSIVLITPSGDGSNSKQIMVDDANSFFGFRYYGDWSDGVWAGGGAGTFWGTYSSLIASNGNVYMAYRADDDSSGTAGGLNYMKLYSSLATEASYALATSPTDTDTGKYCSIALIGQAYPFITHANVSLGSLESVYFDGTNWIRYEIDSSLGAAAGPVINLSSTEVFIAEGDGTVANTRVPVFYVSFNTNPVGINTRVSSNTPTDSGNVSYVDIGVYNSNPYVCYYVADEQAIKYTYQTSGDWTLADNANFSTPAVLVNNVINCNGLDFSMDSNGKAHVAYIDGTTVKYYKQE